ncbi:MAG: Gfo/Idh/MocA family oxidoreductase [Pseudomonadales bacterium]|nr:Gfo/Idh/MocA family oxidoreductase [Pseudomonadales bacterium]
MRRIGVVGTGFVADLYMRSLATMPELEVVAAHDRSSAARERFASHWRVPVVDSLEAVCTAVGPGGIVLNLTNPGAHFEVSRACLEAAVNVYSEKPLATSLDDARTLVDLARSRGLHIASAPCSFLGEAAQAVGAAVRAGMVGTPRLVYAELDDDFVPAAPYRRWKSESGAPWPAEDEFRVGCTLEHAGYYLSWLISIFGSIETVVAASASVTAQSLPVGDPAPDYSSATLFFECGLVARLTCSIAAPHDHRLRIVGDRGLIEVDEAWDNRAPVRVRKRFTVRRRLVYAPIARRVRFRGPTHPHVKRHGAAAMNFALGPLELASALEEGRDARTSEDLALHLTEVTLAIQEAGRDTGPRQMVSRCDPLPPMPWALATGGLRRD